MTRGKPARELVLVVALVSALSLGAATGRSLDVRPPEGWVEAGREADSVTLKPPAGSLFREAVVFDVASLLSQDAESLMPLARAVFPGDAKVGEQSNRRTTLDGYAALEIWGNGTLRDSKLSQATLFVWKGTRMIPVSVLASGGDSAPAREFAAKIARQVRIASRATFFPVPGALPGIIGPANWTPQEMKKRASTAKVVAPDPEEAGPPGTIDYEVLPRSLEPTLEAVLEELEDFAQSRGAERVRTSAVKTRAGKRPALVFQQIVDKRLTVTGAIIRYPEAILRVTYFDLPDRAKRRKALFDALVEQLAQGEIVFPPAGAAADRAMPK